MLELVLRGVGWLAWQAGMTGRRVLAELIGTILYIAAPSRRRLTIANLRRAYPELRHRQLSDLARESYRNLATVFLELLATPYLAPSQIHRMFRFRNPHLVQHKLTEGKGVILVSAHLANWEWSALAATIEFGKPLLVVVKEQRNPRFNAWLDRVRRSTGNETVPMFRAARRMLQWLKTGGIVALLGDQAAEPTSDVFVPLFGQLAATYKAPVVLARRSGAALVFAYCRRATDGSYDVFFETLPEANDEQIPVEEVVAQYNRLLETAVRTAPEQWVWQHHRWKYQPPQSR